MDLPIGLGDRVDAEQAVLAALVDDLGAATAQAMAVDAAVDHDVGYVHALGAILARHALRDHAQARFGGGELGKSGFATEAARRTGKDHRAPAEGDESVIWSPRRSLSSRPQFSPVSTIQNA